MLVVLASALALLGSSPEPKPLSRDLCAVAEAVARDQAKQRLAGEVVLATTPPMMSDFELKLDAIAIDGARLSPTDPLIVRTRQSLWNSSFSCPGAQRIARAAGIRLIRGPLPPDLGGKPAVERRFGAPVIAPDGKLALVLMKQWTGARSALDQLIVVRRGPAGWTVDNFFILGIYN